MGLNYNFTSLIAFGNFNPAIASSDFFNEVCGLDLGKPVEETPASVPVHKIIQFKSVRIIINLDRLEIKHTNIVEAYNPKVLEIFKTYYEKLPYTPLNAVGININCNLTFDKEGDFLRVAAIANNPETYASFFDAKQIGMVEKVSFYGNEKRWQESSFTIKGVNGLTRQISISKIKDSLSINYNNEASNLREDKRALVKFIEGYNEFCDEFSKFEITIRSQ